MANNKKFYALNDTNMSSIDVSYVKNWLPLDGDKPATAEDQFKRSKRLSMSVKTRVYPDLS